MIEFNLSRKMWFVIDEDDNGKSKNVISVEDVKEFIRLLRDNLCNCDAGLISKPDICWVCEHINILAGEKLI